MALFAVVIANLVCLKDHSIQKVDVLGVDFAVTDYQIASDYIVCCAEQGVGSAILALPVHGVIEARSKKEFHRAVKSADLVVPDGQPIRWFMNYFHSTRLKERVYGPELTKHVLARGESTFLKVFLYGGATQKVLDDFSHWIKCMYPKVVIAGSFREPVYGINTLDPEVVVKSGANLVLCGLGCPQQEIWVMKHKAVLSVPLLAVGAAFSFHAGHVRQAPRWMQTAGLEWFYRLMVEPRRLWRRYLTTNSKFLWLVGLHFVFRK